MNRKTTVQLLAENAVLQQQVAVLQATLANPGGTAGFDGEAALHRLAGELERLGAANAELAETIRCKDELLAGLNHDLRTPLTGILGFADILQKGVHGALTEKQCHAVRVIEDSARLLFFMINSMVDLARIHLGKLDLQIGPVSVADVCQASLDEVGHLAAAKQQTIAFNLEPAQGFLLRADSQRLTQILGGLLSNAIKFTPTGGSLGLKVWTEPACEVACFTVWDKGSGIAPTELKRLFKLSADRTTHQYCGNTLGLVLVQHLTELHGGTLTVASTPGEGSRFTLALPWKPRRG
ncbi:MAG: HAMP domain-containing sensor histidine kinase [Candidatus Competibacteraceae bacterium]